MFGGFINIFIRNEITEIMNFELSSIVMSPVNIACGLIKVVRKVQTDQWFQHLLFHQ